MKHKKLSEVYVEGSTYLLSLRAITDMEIVDIHGYISNQFGEPTFKLSQVVFSDGTKMLVEGEHDFPYLTHGSEMSEVLADLYRQEDTDES